MTLPVPSPFSVRSPAAMPPCRRSSSGYRGVRARPASTFYAEIRAGDERISLGTYCSAHEAVHAA